MLAPIKNNPKLSILGLIALAGLAITMYPHVIADLPDEVEQYVKAVAGIVSIIAGAMGFTLSPNKQSNEEKEAEPKPPKAEVVPEEKI